MTEVPREALDTITAAVDAIERRWAAATIDELRDGSATVVVADPLLGVLDRHRELLAARAREPGLARALSVRVLRVLQAKHQFLELDLSALDDLHARTLDALAHAFSEQRAVSTPEALAHAVASALAAHQRAIAALIAHLPPREVLCSEYSPSLQLSLLSLDPQQLAEPILDLGCGEHARLVEALRAQGKEAFGVDRLATHGPWVAQEDWFGYRLEPARFGTIISHLGFTNHFLHHHLRGSDEAFRYARRYMEVLRALAPGGVFAYAPGVPFVEQHLPGAQYVVRRHEITVEPPAWAKGRVELPTYACHVRRVA
ncbi:MAG: class I SAM-dependent methyltransferase [Deltaproteobacteria bacterium]|nr:class I SAM-dependent methyltransferase [Deltaproteobacteria bacterium]